MPNQKDLMVTNRQGKTLAVRQNGSDHAPVIIFSNSLGTDKQMWQPQVDALQHQFRVITYDTRGHGQSDVIADTTLQNLAEDVLDILDNLHIEKAHFCGISMGGMTGLWLAINAAQRFHSVTIANSAAKLGDSSSWDARAHSVETHGMADLVASTHTRWFSPHFDYVHDPLTQQTIQSLAHTPAQGYANACRALAQADLRATINKITIPTLILAGEQDPITTVQDAEFLQQNIVGSRLQRIEASHLSSIEQPIKFTQVLRQFIQSIQ